VGHRNTYIYRIVYRDVTDHAFVGGGTFGSTTVGRSKVSSRAEPYRMLSFFSKEDTNADKFERKGKELLADLAKQERLADEPNPERIMVLRRIDSSGPDQHQQKFCRVQRSERVTLAEVPHRTALRSPPGSPRNTRDSTMATEEVPKLSLMERTMSYSSVASNDTNETYKKGSYTGYTYR
jgi:hypothetical protein